MKYSVKFIQEHLPQEDISEDAKFNEYIEQLKKTPGIPVENIATIRGTGGTGKTSVLGNFLVKLLSKRMDSMKIYVSAPSESSLKAIKDSIQQGTTNTITDLSNDKLIQTILGDKYSAFKNAMDELKKTLDNVGDETVTIKNDVFHGAINGKLKALELVMNDEFLKSAIQTKEFLNPTVILFDEMSRFNTLEWQILNKLGDLENVYIIGSGDEFQNAEVYNGFSLSIDTVITQKSIKLKSTIRAKNIHSAINNEMLERYNESVYNAIYNDDKPPFDFDEQLNYSLVDDKLNGH